MRTPSHLGVRIGSHFNKNAYMHEKTTIEFGVRIVGRKNLNWCTPFFAVSQWVGLKANTYESQGRIQGRGEEGHGPAPWPRLPHQIA